MGDLDHIRQFLANERTLICFNGPFMHSIIEELGKAVRKHLESEEVKKSALADVFAVFIEVGQNVSNYACHPQWTDEERARLQNGVLVIGRQDEHYTIRCGNFIHPRDSAPLLARLDRLAALDPQGLKALYKEQLRAPLPPGSTGAGLGLIRMARIASQPLLYSLGPEEEAGFAFFTLTVTL